MAATVLPRDAVGWAGRGRGHPGAVGGAHRAAPGGRAGPRRAAVRVLRAGVDRGLAGSGDVAGAAAGAGRGAGGRAREDRGGVLRRRAEPDAAVGAPPAGRGAGRGAGRPGPGMGRDRDRGVRAGVLRQPVRVDGAAVRALRRPAVDAGGGRAGRLARRGPRADDAGAGVVSPSGRSPGPGSGSAPRWRPRPASRAGTWAAARRTGTGWPMPGRTRTRRTPPGAAGRTGWSPTRRPRRWCGGCSPSGWPGTAPPGSPGR